MLNKPIHKGTSQAVIISLVVYVICVFFYLCYAGAGFGSFQTEPQPSIGQALLKCVPLFLIIFVLTLNGAHAKSPSNVRQFSEHPKLEKAWKIFLIILVVCVGIIVFGSIIVGIISSAHQG